MEARCLDKRRRKSICRSFIIRQDGTPAASFQRSASPATSGQLNRQTPRDLLCLVGVVHHLIKTGCSPPGLDPSLLNRFSRASIPLPGRYSSGERGLFADARAWPSRRAVGRLGVALDDCPLDDPCAPGCHCHLFAIFTKRKSAQSPRPPKGQARLGPGAD